MSREEEKLEEVRKMTEEVAAVCSHPEFYKILKHIETLPTIKEKEDYVKTLTPQKLKELGVPIPEAFRITTRYFEDPLSEEIQSKKIGEAGLSVDKDLDVDMAASTTVCTSVGYLVCQTVGRTIE